MPCNGINFVGVPCVVLPNFSSTVYEAPLLQVLSTELYGDHPGMAVSVLELAARGYLVVSLAVLFRAVSSKKTPKVLLQDAWGA